MEEACPWGGGVSSGVWVVWMGVVAVVVDFESEQ